MLQLFPVTFDQIQSFGIDFQKKSKCYELAPEEAEFLGIYKEGQFIGYFIIVTYNTGELEINQGYLLKEFRHKGYEIESMVCLENIAKRYKFNKIILGSNRSLRAYTKFMGKLGYKPTRIIYSKEV